MTIGFSGITVPGTAGSMVTVTAGAGDHFKLAQSMADALAVAAGHASLPGSPAVPNTLTVSSVGSGALVTAASVGGSNTSELLIASLGGGITSVPASPNIGAGYSFVVDVAASSNTVIASNAHYSGVAVLANDVGNTIIVDGVNTIPGSTSVPSGAYSPTHTSGPPVLGAAIAATGGNNFIQVTATNYIVSTGDGNDTIVASGAGSVGAGYGSNIISVTGSPVYVEALGHDTISQVNGDATVNAQSVGSGLYVSGGSFSFDTLVVNIGTSGTMPGAGSGAKVVAGAGSTSVTLAGANGVVKGGTGSLYVAASGANDAIVAGAGSSTISTSGPAASIYGAVSMGGPMFVNDSSAGGFVSARQASSSNIVVSGDSVAVYGGTGAMNLLFSGTHNTLSGGTGGSSAAVTVSGTNNVVFGGTGDFTALVNNASNTVIAGGAGSTITAAAGAVVSGHDNATGPLVFIGGAGTSSVIGGAGGTDLVTVGTGGVLFGSGINAHATVTGGTGQATLFGGAGSMVTFLGSVGGGAYFVAGSGNETLLAAASATNNTFAGSSVAGTQQQFIGGTGSDTLMAGAGAVTMTGGAGSDAFVFFRAATSGAADVITDFTSSDSLFFVGYDSTQSATLLQANAYGPAVASPGNSGLTLKLSDNTTVTFTNLTDIHQLDGRILYG